MVSASIYVAKRAADGIIFQIWKYFYPDLTSTLGDGDWYNMCVLVIHMYVSIYVWKSGPAHRSCRALHPVLGYKP